jgi:hypothetical protein
MTCLKTEAERFEKTLGSFPKKSLQPHMTRGPFYGAGINP